MRMYDLILKKRNGVSLTQDEIQWMIENYLNGSIPDYQMSALMMAVYFRGMDSQETYRLTMAMAESGDMLELSQIPGIKVDKHSTGGVGDKTSLALGPLVASCGIPVAKMSGRGLGHTGGTIDKLESIPGFCTSLTEEQFMRQVTEVGIAIMGQTKDLAPADKLLYALRDVTATVDQTSLIASSIMSKKLAAGADAILLDVKCGSGAFMKSLEDAEELAKAMIDIGKKAGRNMAAVISDMDQPLGRAVGNALEVKEAADTLKGEGPEDFTELVLTLGAQMLCMAGKSGSAGEARRILEQKISSGEAIEKFREFAAAQGGDPSWIDQPENFSRANYIEEILSEDSGYISAFNTQEIGICSLILGGGRETKESRIDSSVGLVLQKKKGDPVSAGECLAVIHANDRQKLKDARQHFLKNVSISGEQVTPGPIVKKIFS
ncbi:pyrimidine-nucleoside phosphorylase [Anaerostipes sp.]|uniref:pyrimidine-nucleoside phosphorylase n=1 Tax=Anaerostipes sp. TaxID=1872530 RepID=UPI0025B8250D|nr:pyrimidine-nucleoside phosphorylase [Anaerostipes sp.]MBS7009820.1 pyrimidine-nucleoside phosphorylase [Anaerostipes sp.]